MISISRLLILSTMLCLAASGAAQAVCQGHDLFPVLKSQAPAAYAAIEAAASAMPFRYGKLFRLSRAGTEPSYLFATLHLSDPRVITFAPAVRDAIAHSKIVLLETIETGEVLRRAIAKNPAAWRRAILAREDERAGRLLSKADFAELEAYVARMGFAESAAREFKPSTLSFLLDQPDCAPRGPQANPYVDKMVADLARENKVETAGLESMAEQLDVPNGLPRETGRDLLVAVLRQAEHGADVAETAIERYREGDIGGLLAWMRSEEPIPGVPQAQIPPAFLDRLITFRNVRMRERALPYLSQGGAFIAVGAAHLPGREGLLSLFEKEGYRIERLE